MFACLIFFIYLCTIIKNIFLCFNDYIKIVGVLRKNVITNEPYFTRWEELSCSEQNILFGIAINLFNKYEND